MDRTEVRTITVEVGLPPSALPDADRVEAEVFVPTQPGGAAVIAVPGGGMSRRYFDLAAEGYSMSRHLAAQGIVVITIDLPGVGADPAPPDPAGYHPDVLADLLGDVAGRLIDGLRQGQLVDGLGPMPELRAFGLGHSMGAVLTLTAQAHRNPFDGLVLLGWSGRGLPEALLADEAEFAGRAEELRHEIGRLARSRFGTDLPRQAPPSNSGPATSDFLIVVPIADDVRRALREASTAMLTQAGLWAMIPGSHDWECAAVGVPVFCGVGEFDITGDPTALAGYLPNAEVTVLVLPGAGHNANVAPGRAVLWDAIAGWCQDRTPSSPP